MRLWKAWGTTTWTASSTGTIRTTNLCLSKICLAFDSPKFSRACLREGSKPSVARTPVVLRLLPPSQRRCRQRFVLLLACLLHPREGLCLWQEECSDYFPKWFQVWQLVSHLSPEFDPFRWLWKRKVYQRPDVWFQRDVRHQCKTWIDLRAIGPSD